MVNRWSWVRQPLGLLLAALALGWPTLLLAQGSGGRVAGRVIVAETGRPLAGARIGVSGQTGVLETDLDGRFRSPPLPTGLYVIRASMIGFKPVVSDTVKIEDGQVKEVSFALQASPIQLEELVVETSEPAKAAKDAGLLALQQAAPAVTDGISAQAIARSPDRDAGEAVRR